MIATCTFCGIPQAAVWTDALCVCPDCEERGLADEHTDWSGPVNRVQTPKPLGRKAYGSIPHLLGSRLGAGDHHVPPGQHAICTHRARDRHDRIIVTEKLDGSNVALANIGGVLHVLNRAGYQTRTSPFPLHHLLADWVQPRRRWFLDHLQDGDALHAEWMPQAHGLRYCLPHGPLVAFDLTRHGKRLPHDLARECFKALELPAASVLSDGPPLAVSEARRHASRHGAWDRPEGFVWRIERQGAFDFIAKWVRPDKTDGYHLPELTGLPPVWNSWLD